MNHHTVKGTFTVPGIGKNSNRLNDDNAKCKASPILLIKLLNFIVRKNYCIRYQLSLAQAQGLNKLH